MEHKSPYLDMIDAWLDKRLYGEALARFEWERQNNPTLAEECAIAAALHEGAKQQQKAHFRQRLATIKMELEEENALEEQSWIAQYLNGTLNGTVLDAFRQRLATDPDFAALVNIQAALQQERTAAKRAQFKTKLADIKRALKAEATDATIQTQPVRRAKWIRLNPTLLALAASLVLIAFATRFILIGQGIDAGHEILEQNLISWPVTPSAFSGEAYGLVKKGQYKEALPEVRKIPGDKARIYEAICLLGLSRKFRNYAPEAMALLQPIAGSDLDAKSYLALAYLMSGRTNEARKTAETLKNTPNARQTHLEFAEKLLVRLKELE